MKKFNMIDENFICEHCGKEVKKAEYTARDHCPYCLYSKHVDINPGDRENTCKGLLKPIGIEKYSDIIEDSIMQIHGLKDKRLKILCCTPGFHGCFQ